VFSSTFTWARHIHTGQGRRRRNLDLFQPPRAD
jgi:hypothetical protein